MSARPTVKRYYVYSALAGYSSCRTLRRVFKSRAAAERFAASLNGYGVYGVVTER